MSYYYGKLAAVKVSTNTVIQCRSWKGQMTTKDQDLTALGDSFEKSVPLSNKWSATVEALFDLADTNGQLALVNAYLANTKLTDVRLYVDSSKYWGPDTGTDATAGCYITQIQPAQTQSGVATIEFTISGYGPGKWT